MMFYQSFRLIQNEKKVRKKSKRWAVLFILLLILMLFFPFISEHIRDEQTIAGIVIDFAQEEIEEFDNSSSSSAEKSSSRASSNEAETPSEEAPAPPTPSETVAETPTPAEKTPEPTTAEVTPLPTSRPSPITETTPREINFESMLKNIPEKAKVEEVSEEVVEVANDNMSQESINEIADYFKNSSRGDKKTSGSGTAESSGSTSPDSGNSSTAGEGDSGSSDSGNSPTDGKSNKPSDQGTGSSPGEGIDFDGKINREVVHRENFSGLAKKDGAIVISLCINRDGKVIYTKANKAKSSYKDAATLRKAELIVKKNRYKRDYTVAERQCGTYTYIIKGVE